MSRRERWSHVLIWACLVVLLYVGTAWSVFLFRHPDMTDRRAMFHFWDAMCWRQVQP